MIVSMADLSKLLPMNIEQLNQIIEIAIATRMARIKLDQEIEELGE